MNISKKIHTTHNQSNLQNIIEEENAESVSNSSQTESYLKRGTVNDEDLDKQESKNEENIEMTKKNTFLSKSSTTMEKSTSPNKKVAGILKRTNTEKSIKELDSSESEDEIRDRYIASRRISTSQSNYRNRTMSRKSVSFYN